MLRLPAIMLAAALMTTPASAQTLLRTDAQGVTLSASSLTAEVPVSRDIPTNAIERSSRDRGTGFAAAVLQVLAAQNTIELLAPPPSEMDAYLRPPSAGNGGSSLFTQARNLYDVATSYSTDRYDLEVDPLGMRCRVRINLIPFLNRGD